MSLSDQINTRLQPYLEDGKYYIVDLQVSGIKVRPKISILLDCDEGITIQECARISRKLANDMEADEVMDAAYTLEVSSPGLDQPLKLLRQYKRNVGRLLKVTLNDGEILSGRLQEVKEDSIVLELSLPKKKSKVPVVTEPVREFKLDEIAKALVQVVF
jgi:ribosome maturation factor RimP